MAAVAVQFGRYFREATWCVAEASVFIWVYPRFNRHVLEKASAGPPIANAEADGVDAGVGIGLAAVGQMLIEETHGDAAAG